jgi:hypothetical protein
MRVAPGYIRSSGGPPIIAILAAATSMPHGSIRHVSPERHIFRIIA